MHFFYRIWDCDTCIRDVKLVAEVYTSLDAIIEWIGIFQGLIFQDLELSKDQDFRNIEMSAPGRFENPFREERQYLEFMNS